MQVNDAALERACGEFRNANPFDHMVIDDFFRPDIAAGLEHEFPAFESSCWHSYDNAIEIKKACNDWNRFPPVTYRTFSYLNSLEFVGSLSALLGIAALSADSGLNGGGWHVHGCGGKLNPHLDYNIHPKLGLQRKLSVIAYLNREWHPKWGGQLGLWRQDNGLPGKLVKAIDPLFNRAVIFDTTQNSWHGLATPVACPEGRIRKSLAVCYLAPPAPDAESRGKSLFAPAPEQRGERSLLELIDRRARSDLAATVYHSPKVGRGNS